MTQDLRRTAKEIGTHVAAEVQDENKRRTQQALQNVYIAEKQQQEQVPVEPLPDADNKDEQSSLLALSYDAQNNTYWFGKFGVTELGMYVEDATEVEWKAFGETIARLDSAGEWIKADWIRYGHDILGKSYKDLAAIAGMKSEKSAEVYASISRTASELIRINSPSFSHYRLIVSYPEEQKLTWLKRAREEGMSVAAMRSAMLNEPTLLTATTSRHRQFAPDMAAKRKELTEISKTLSRAGLGDPKAKTEVKKWLSAQRKWLDEVEDWVSGE